MKNLEKIGREAVEKRNFELVDVEFVKEAGHWYLRYYIDKEGGITIDDCQLVSEDISRQLDITDPIPYSYILEVSSPGIERPLKNDRDFSKAVGSMVEIKTYEPFENKKIFSGILKDFSEGIVTVEDKKVFKIPKDSISSAKMKFE
ncbi:ribosome maturation factor RimP [Thermoanaerobacteraceae bacterium SP2]|nr:ribosome maturation factor RimP [Thermoanaerobacteraceae bacterium SP2]